MKVVIAAAGTGGHINPGIAIANKIMEKEPQSKIIFIGTGRGLEKDLVPRAGYELKTVEAYGINRKINLDNIKRLCKTIKAVGQAKKILKEFYNILNKNKCQRFLVTFFFLFSTIFLSPYRNQHFCFTKFSLKRFLLSASTNILPHLNKINVKMYCYR